MKTVAWSAVCCAVLILGAIGCLGNQLVISEVAWGGTAASSNDEWIELHNLGETDIDLAGWALTFGDTYIPLGHIGDDTLDVRTPVLSAGAFLLLERTDDTSVSNLAADIIYKGTLSNGGMVMQLVNPDGDVVDSIVALESGWPAGGAGDSEPPYCSMERTDDGEWIANDGSIANGLDADGTPINGTPGQVNSDVILAQWAPAVDLLFPAEEGIVLSGAVVVSWTASDPDGADSSLAIALLISENDGSDWVIVVEGLTNSGTYVWDTTAHASGGAIQLMVRALDVEGYVGQAVSPSFALSNEDS